MIFTGSNRLHQTKAQDIPNWSIATNVNQKKIRGFFIKFIDLLRKVIASGSRRTITAMECHVFAKLPNKGNKYLTIQQYIFMTRSGCVSALVPKLKYMNNNKNGRKMFHVFLINFSKRHVNCNKRCVIENKQTQTKQDAKINKICFL